MAESLNQEIFPDMVPADPDVCRQQWPHEDHWEMSNPLFGYDDPYYHNHDPDADVDEEWKTGKKGMLELKLDISKAYDRGEWDFLKKMMSKLEFPNVWVERVMTCVSTPSFSVRINGKAFSNVKPTRVLRQGARLSPYLFLLCAKEFTALLAKKEAEGRLHGVSIGRRAPTISHILFADDSLLFCRATMEEVRCISDTLQLYAAASGQCISFEKSSVYFSSNTKRVQREAIKNELGVKEEWDRELIETKFHKEDAGAIFCMPLSRRHAFDLIIWLHTKNEEYSVRSGYYVARELLRQESNKGECSEEDKGELLWRHLWKLHIPNKFKVFGWKVCQNALPTRENLARCKVVEDGCCQVCRLNSKSVAHMLWQCGVTQDIWASSIRKIQKSITGQPKFMQIVEGLMHKLTEEEQELFWVQCLTIWNQQN
ncbi:uncharacterized protein LOC142606033 [Castanea sativa]|uniref:uncharacterized protein LOC142606033 n=1 Tax=Castanea sativa TaxID=21020 RepID=UPI003F64F1EC